MTDYTRIHDKGVNGKPLDFQDAPLTVTGVTIDNNTVHLNYLTPFDKRQHEILRKTEVNNPDGNWVILKNTTISRTGPGRRKASFEVVGDDASFFRVKAIALPPVFTENFEESDLANWEIGGFPAGLWEAGEPEDGIGPEAEEGTRVLATGISETFVESTDAYVRTPIIDLTEIKSGKLHFSEWFDVDPEVDYHQMVVNIVSPGAQDGEILKEISRAAGKSNQWIRRTIDLPREAIGRQVQVEFRLITDRFNLLPGWFIDSISITED